VFPFAGKTFYLMNQPYYIGLADMFYEKGYLGSTGTLFPVIEFVG